MIARPNITAEKCVVHALELLQQADDLAAAATPGEVSMHAAAHSVAMRALGWLKLSESGMLAHEPWADGW